MLQFKFSRRYLKDAKKWKRSGKSMRPLNEFLSEIEHTCPPPAKYKPHLLTGTMEGIWDIHLQQNWILLLRYHEGTVYFLRMGTDAESGV